MSGSTGNKSVQATQSKKSHFLLRLCRTSIGCLLLVGLLVLSPWGARLAVYLSNQLVSEIQIEYDKGSLWSELLLSSLRWQQTGVDVRLTTLTLDLNLACFAQLAVCVKSVAVADLVINIALKDQVSQDHNNQTVQLPVPLYIEDIELGQLSLVLDQQLSVVWQKLSGSFDFYRQLTIHELLVRGLVVKQTVSSAAVKPRQTFDLAKWTYSPLWAGPIPLPIEFNIKDLQLPSVSIELVDQAPLRVTGITLQVEANQQQIQLHRLAAEHVSGNIKAQGKVSLDGKLTHNLSVQAQTLVIESQPLQLALLSQGDINRLKADLNITGAIELDARLDTQLANNNLPVDLQINWQQLVWPLVEPAFESEVGTLQLQGNLQAFELSLSAGLSGESLPNTEIKLAAKGAKQTGSAQLTVEQLLVQTLGGNIHTTGQLALTESLRWQGETALDNIDIGAFWPLYPASLKGQLSSQVTQQDGLWLGEINDADINGLWRSLPLSIRGGGSYHQQQGLLFQPLLIVNADNRLELRGSAHLDTKLNITFDLNAPDLSDSVAQFSGSMQAQGQVLGSQQKPQLIYQIQGQELGFDKVKIAALEASGQLLWDALKPIDLGFRLRDITLAQQQLAKLDLRVTGDALAHQLVLSGSHDDAALEMTVSGRLEASVWQGKWLSGNIHTTAVQLALQQPFELLADWQSQEFKVGAHCWAGLQSELCIKQAKWAQQQGTLDFSVQNFAIAGLVRQLFEPLKNLHSASRMDLNFSGVWQPERLPEAHLALSLSPAIWQFDGNRKLQLSIQETAFNAVISSQGLTLDGNLAGPEIGQMKLQLEATALQDGLSGPIAGQAQLMAFDLAPFRPLLADVEILQGQLQGMATITGSFDKPWLMGQLTLQGGALKAEALPITLSKVTQIVTLKGDNADFSGDYRLGEGIGQLDGQLRWSPELRGQVNIKGNALEFNYLNNINTQLSPDIELSFTAAQAQIKGQLVIPAAKVLIADLPKGSITKSADVVMVEQQQLTSSTKQQLKIDLLVKIDPLSLGKVQLAAFGLTTQLQGQVRLQSNSLGLTANGDLALKNGKYDAYGQNLLIRTGDISFNGQLTQPYLNIEAIRDPQLTEDDVIAGLRIEGVSSRPNISIFSEPSLDEAQSLSYILTGRGVGQSDSSKKDRVLAGALLSIGLGKSANLVSQVGNKLGIEDFNLDTSGKGDETQVSLRGNVGNGVELRYGVGVFDSVSEVAIRYELMPKLYIEAVSGLNNAIDIYYQFSRHSDAIKEADNE